MSTGFVNFEAQLSNDKFQLFTRSGNAVVSGLDYGWFKLEYDSVLQKMRVRLYANQNDAAGDYRAGSDLVALASLPAAISLVDNVGIVGTVTATLDVNGVR